MDVPGLFLYLLFLTVFLVAQTILRRRRAALHAAMRKKEDMLASAGLDRPSVLAQTAAAKRHEKLTHPTGYRSIESRQDAAPTWTTKQSAVKKSVYREQFKNHRSIRHAVVSLVVLGPCRAKEPMTF
jgi:hypothetical protein